MRRTVIYKSSAIRAVILIFAALIIMSVYPLRLYKRTITDHGDAEFVQTSDRINDYHDVVQKFIARYDRIKSVDIYVDSVEKGQYMSVVVYKPSMEVYYSRYIYLGDKNLPGYVNVPLGLDLEVGETYTILVNGCLSTFYLGYGASDPAVYPYVLNFSYHDTEVPGLCLLAKYNYEQPIDKVDSLAVIAAALTIVAILILAVKISYRNDKLITVHRVIRFVGNPVAIVIAAALMVMIFPLRIFDQRPVEIIFYETGIIISAIFVLYAINHESDATMDIKPWHNLHNLIRMTAIAAAIWFCCEYMNALYTIYQTMAERKEMICLLLLLCLMIPKEKILRGYNLLYIVISCAAGAVYRSSHLMAETEKEYDLHNAVTTYGVIIAVLAGFILLTMGAYICERIKEHRSKSGVSSKNQISLLGYMLIVLGLILMVFRNTRWWGVVLMLFVFALMSIYAVFVNTDEEAKKEYHEIIMGGILLNFVVSMIYCWLYRSYAAFNTGRYPFVFHTVTVTAEYLTVMVSAAMVMLLYKIYDTRDVKGLWNRFRYMWKEFILFGFVTAYMIFTMSRTAYLACVAVFVAICILTASDNKKHRLQYFLFQTCILAASVVLCFPAAFTLQRILPAINGHPRTFIIENQNYELNGGGNPSSGHFMSIERFVDLFGEKILSTDLIDYRYPDDLYNYNEEGRPIYGETGVYLTEQQSYDNKTSLLELITLESTDEETKEYLRMSAGDELLAAASQSGDEGTEETAKEETNEEDSEESGGISEDTIENFSNGRLTIFKSYLEQMTLFGHDEMGAVLPWGEVAIHAHDTYIQVMYDNGIFAGIVFLCVIAVAVISGGVYYVKNRQHIPGCLFPYAMTIGFGFAAISEWVFQLSNPMTIALMLALMPLTLKDKQ